LFTESWSPTTRARLSALAASTNGFALAQKDLALRGPGSFVGVAQSGFSDTLVQGLANPKLITETRICAEKLFETLKAYPLLEERMRLFSKKVHLE